MRTTADIDRDRLDRALQDRANLKSYAAARGLTLATDQPKPHAPLMHRLILLRVGRLTVGKWWPTTGRVTVAGRSDRVETLKEAIDWVASNL